MNSKILLHTTTLSILAFLVLAGLHTKAMGEPASASFLEGWAAYENKDYSSALKHWKPLAEEGNPDAQYLVGIMFSNGLGVPVDFEKAGKWFLKSATQGDVGAQYLTGVFLASGKGFSKDLNRASHWFKEAARQGYPDAQSRLGEWYADGKGVKQNLTKAYIWLSLAQANGIQTVETKLVEVANQMTTEELKNANRLAQQLWDRQETR